MSSLIAGFSDAGMAANLFSSGSYTVIFADSRPSALLTFRFCPRLSWNHPYVPAFLLFYGWLMVTLSNFPVTMPVSIPLPHAPSTLR